jgi:hypothetical protein
VGGILPTAQSGESTFPDELADAVLQKEPGPFRQSAGKPARERLGVDNRHTQAARPVAQQVKPTDMLVAIRLHRLLLVTQFTGFFLAPQPRMACEST